MVHGPMEIVHTAVALLLSFCCDPQAFCERGRGGRNWEGRGRKGDAGRETAGREMQSGVGVRHIALSDRSLRQTCLERDARCLPIRNLNFDLDLLPENPLVAHSSAMGDTISAMTALQQYKIQKATHLESTSSQGQISGEGILRLRKPEFGAEFPETDFGRTNFCV